MRRVLCRSIYDMKYLPSIISGSTWGRSDATNFKDKNLYKFFNNTDTKTGYKVAYNIAYNKQLFDEKDYTLMEALISNSGVKIPEEIVSKRFWILFILLSRNSSLELTELSNNKKYSVTINDFIESFIKYILKDVSLGYTNIRRAVNDSEFRKRIMQVQITIGVILHNSTKKTYDLNQYNFDIDVKDVKDVLDSTHYTNIIDKFIEEKSVNPVVTFTSDNDFEVTKTNVNNALNLLVPSSSSDKVSINLTNSTVPQPKFYIRTPLTISDQFIDFITTRVH